MRQLFVIVMFLVLIGHGFGPVAHAISITVYTDRSNWESALSGNYTEEDFSDTTLNPGLSVVSDSGYVDTGNQFWWDRMSGSPNDCTTTAFPFVIPASIFSIDTPLGSLNIALIFWYSSSRDKFSPDEI